jgi:hypothetical protein
MILILLIILVIISITRGIYSNNVSCDDDSKTNDDINSISGSSSISPYNLRGHMYRPLYNGYRKDDEILNKSGGMVSYSTHPYDTNSDGGYVNYPYSMPNYSPYYTYTNSLYYPYTNSPYINSPYTNNFSYYPQSLMYNYHNNRHNNRYNNRHNHKNSRRKKDRHNKDDDDK